MKKLSIKEAVKHEPLKTFEDADKQAKEIKELKNTTGQKKAGRPIQGKSKATHKIYFVVNDEQYDYLKSLMDYDKKLNSPSAVAKMLFLKDYDIHMKE